MSDEPMTLFGIEFHPPGEAWLANARHLDRRMELAELAADAISGSDGDSVMALPAGFLRASSLAQRDAMADTLLALSKRAQIGIVFGIDVTPDDLWAPLSVPPEVYAYACEEGRRLLWPTQQVRGAARDKLDRCVRFAAGRIGLLISAEVFNSGIRQRLCQGKPDAVVVLAHARANRRWASALDSLDQWVPTLVVGQELQPTRRASDDDEPAVRAVNDGLQGERRGFRHGILGRTGEMTLHQFRLAPSDPACRAVA